MTTHEKRATELVEDALDEPFADTRRDLLAAATVYANLALAKAQTAAARAMAKNAATVDRVMSAQEPAAEVAP